MTTTTYPPFAPNGATLPDMVSAAERKRTGHMFTDCPARDLPAPKKAVACAPCVARYAEASSLAAKTQGAYDAAYVPETDPTASLARQDARYRSATDADVVIPKVDHVEAHVDVPPARRAPERTNRFVGRCSACGFTVQANEGVLSGRPGGWVTTHQAGACPAPKEQAPNARVL